MSARSAQELWEAALGELQLQVSKANYRTWLEKTVGLALENGQFIVGVPNTFIAEYLEQNQRSLIEKHLTALIQNDTRVVFQIGTKQQNSTYHHGLHPQTTATRPEGKPTLNPRYTFDTFVVGSCNRLAHAAAVGVAENPGHGYNPLFVYGGAGLGKTHLLQAICHVATTTCLQVLYASAEQFTNEFIRAIRHGKTEDFHNKYRSVDMLLIDDIQFIGGKEQTEESFFHTFNELHNACHQIVISSDCPPESISLLQGRLRSRFEWGLIVDVQPPDWETRLAILQAKTEYLGVRIPPEVLEFIAQQGQQNIRQLEGALNRVIAYTRLVRALPTTDLAAQALQDIAGKRLKEASVTPGQVIKAVASSYNLTPADLKSRQKDKETVLARQIAMYLIRQHTPCSLKQIGKELGGRNHSTVIHACERIAIDLGTSPQLKRKLTDIEQSIRSRT